ncbi:MAG: hypothetical protein ACXV5I_09645 [Halobacteriota archaeon]
MRDKESHAGAARHSQAIDYLPGLVPATFLEAWVVERGGDQKRAAEVYRRALELSDRAGFADHASFALARLAAIALAGGEVVQAEQLARRALAGAEAARAPAAAAHARVQLGRVLAASGDADAAEHLYRNVAAWADTPRTRLGRETLFDALGGNPVAAASLGLAEIAEAQTALAPQPAS